MPDGQITGPAGSNTSRRLAHLSYSFETTPSPPMPYAFSNIPRLAFHPDYAAIGSVTTLAALRPSQDRPDRGQQFGMVEPWIEGNSFEALHLKGSIIRCRRWRFCGGGKRRRILGRLRRLRRRGQGSSRREQGNVG